VDELLLSRDYGQWRKRIRGIVRMNVTRAE